MIFKTFAIVLSKRFDTPETVAAYMGHVETFMSLYLELPRINRPISKDFTITRLGNISYEISEDDISPTDHGLRRSAQCADLTAWAPRTLHHCS